MFYFHFYFFSPWILWFSWLIELTFDYYWSLMICIQTHPMLLSWGNGLNTLALTSIPLLLWLKFNPFIMKLIFPVHMCKGSCTMFILFHCRCNSRDHALGVLWSWPGVPDIAGRLVRGCDCCNEVQGILSSTRPGAAVGGARAWGWEWWLGPCLFVAGLHVFARWRRRGDSSYHFQILWWWEGHACLCHVEFSAGFAQQGLRRTPWGFAIL